MGEHNKILFEISFLITTKIGVERSSIKGSDCYDRYRVRVEEMIQSARMILDAFTHFPGGADTHYSK